MGAVLLGVGIFLLHREVERRIDQIGKLSVILLAVVVLFVGIALDAASRRASYLVPSAEEGEYYFLKTIIPSRKATRDYLGKDEPDEKT